MTSPLLELDGISKRFGRTVTADGISLGLGRGEFFTLLGPSGSGKSTILRMIAGLERPDEGRIQIGGRDVTDLPPWKRGLGMVFQSYAVFPHLTVGKNVGYGLRRLDMEGDAQSRRVEELLELVGLAGFAGRYPAALSGGEMQRVAIARALAPKPKLLLLDEPLSALDEKIRREMQGELRRIQESTDTSFFYITHDQEEALTMSDRVAVLNGGRVVQNDAPERIFSRPRTAFVARFFRGCNVLEVERSGRDGMLANARLPVELPEDCRAVAVRSEHVRMEPDEANELILDATLESSTFRGLYTEHLLRLADDQLISVAEQGHREIEAGAWLRIGVPTDRIVPLDPA